MHKEPNCADSLISDVHPPELWEIGICCLSHPAYGTLLQQPTLRRTMNTTKKEKGTTGFQKSKYLADQGLQRRRTRTPSPDDQTDVQAQNQL